MCLTQICVWDRDVFNTAPENEHTWLVNANIVFSTHVWRKYQTKTYCLCACTLCKIPLFPMKRTIECSWHQKITWHPDATDTHISDIPTDRVEHQVVAPRSDILAPKVEFLNFILHRLRIWSYTFWDKLSVSQQYASNNCQTNMHCRKQHFNSRTHQVL